MRFQRVFFFFPVLLLSLPLWSDESATLPVTPETRASFLENLAVPHPDAQQAHLPDPLMSQNEWRGVYCGITQDDQVIFRNEQDWTLFWDKAMRPYSHHFKTMPVIDFSKEMVLGVFWGEKRHPGYEIQITGFKKRMRRDDATEVLVVHYKKTTRPVGVFVPPLAVQPFDLVRQPRFPGPIHFLEQKK